MSDLVVTHKIVISYNICPTLKTRNRENKGSSIVCLKRCLQFVMLCYCFLVVSKLVHIWNAHGYSISAQIIFSKATKPPYRSVHIQIPWL